MSLIWNAIAGGSRATYYTPALFSGTQALLMYRNFLTILLCVFALSASGQQFPDTRILNGHSPEVLRSGILEFCVGHRFGDIAGEAGGFKTLFGIEDASDIRLGFEYGINDRLMAGLGRNKGAGPARGLVETFLKYKALVPTKERPSLPTITLLGNAVMSTMPRSNDSTEVASFPSFIHRFSYMGQVMVSRHIGEWVGLAVSGIVLHRNYVPFGDRNTTAYLGIGWHVDIGNSWHLLGDFNVPFTAAPEGYMPPLAAGICYETGGGHVFTVMLGNTRGMLENDFLPYSTSNLLDGQFRLGFQIVRKFMP